VWTELGQNRYPTLPFALVPFSVGDTDSAAVPINIGPCECQVLTGTAQSAKPAEGKDQPPLGIRTGIENALRVFKGEEVITLTVAADRAFQAPEWVASDEFPLNGILKELFCMGNPLTGRV